MNGFLKKSNTRVFVALIPENIEITEVYPPERYAEITNVTNERVRREKYFVWRLLEYAIKKSRGENIKDVAFRKCESGRWVAEDFDFSLSHSDGVAAVAISDSCVGVDIEEVSCPRAESFAKRVLSSCEHEEFSSLPADKREENLIKKWTAKEAAFKSRNEDKFLPAKTEVNLDKIKTDVVLINGRKYVLSVFAVDSEEIDVEIVDSVL